MITQANTQRRTFILAYPIYNLEISREVGGEIQIERVLFISKEKLPRVRKRLGFKKTFSDINKAYSKYKIPRLFEKSPATSFAIIKVKRFPQDELIDPLLKIKDAIWILASSQFGNPRSSIRYFGLPEYQKNMSTEFYLHDTKEKASIRSFTRVSPIHPFKLDKIWHNSKHHFFPFLLKIINNEKIIKPKWKKNIRDAAILAGQSHFSREISQVFLFDFIAIDNLLSIRGEKYPDCLIDRLHALFGFMSDENPRIWEQRINRLYKLRNNMVHDGNTRDIKTEDIIFTDNILFNLLFNICRKINFFPEKSALLDLSLKVKARNILGQQVKERVGLMYRRAVLTENTVKKIKKENNWP